ncbi:MAG TPA: tRNA lysidine(34) synthetase TilS [Thermoanaerobaculia bacterium]|nr:tRNA lysidine(34) synthetase TilS [Thermoanaerobaculia bacterium]
MRTTIRQFFVKEGIPDACRIVVAVSGGVDSTALLVALHGMEELELVAAHVNHHLRGAESDADEQFVRDLCAQLEVPLRVADGTLDPECVKARGIEAAAREVRYAALQRIREDEGARYVATAHQKNDQAETVLMRLMSGSGIAGLRGIHPHREDGFIRPLLAVTRKEIERFLAERNVTPRIDRSNEDPRFLRNRVRAFLRDGDAIDNLAAIADQARAQWPILEKAIDGAEHVEASDDATIFNTWPDNEWLRGALLQRHIRRLDPSARDFDASRIANDDSPRISVTKNLELLRRGNERILRRRLEPTPDFELTLNANEDAHIEAIAKTIHLRQPPTANRQPIELPQGANVRFTVRNRRPGDRFQPLGMSQPKKLKDFLIDRKIDAGVRDRIPLLVWNGEIVWVGGVEVSERFRVRGAGGVLCEVWIDERDTATGLQR